MSEIHVNKDDQQIGPFQVDEINWKLETGEIAATDMGWIDGMLEWKPLADETFAAVGVELPGDDAELPTRTAELDETAEEMPAEEAPSAPPPAPSPRRRSSRRL